MWEDYNGYTLDRVVESGESLQVEMYPRSRIVFQLHLLFNSPNAWIIYLRLVRKKKKKRAETRYKTPYFTSVRQYPWCDGSVTGELSGVFGPWMGWDQLPYHLLVLFCPALCIHLLPPVSPGTAGSVGLTHALSHADCSLSTIGFETSFGCFAITVRNHQGCKMVVGVQFHQGYSAFRGGLPRTDHRVNPSSFFQEEVWQYSGHSGLYGSGWASTARLCPH